jgi:hypothetical protein
MHRFVMIVALLGAFAVGSVGTVVGVAAQDATPEAPQTVGDLAVYVDDQGDEVARATVEEVIDPFEDYEEGSDPERGTRFVAIRLTVEATGEDAVEVQANDLSLLDSQGFWLGDSTVYRTEDQEAEDPLLEDTELAPGDSVSGLILFVAFEENDIDQVFWQPESDRLITLANVS